MGELTLFTATVITWVLFFLLGLAASGFQTGSDICKEYFDNEYQVVICAKLRSEKLKMKEIINHPLILKMEK